LNFCMMARTLTWIHADRLKINPERRHKVKGRTSFAFSGIRPIIAEADLDPDFERLCPKYSSFPINSVVAVLLRIVRLNEFLRNFSKMIGNVKNAMTGTYHAINPKYLSRYLAEFCYRFNRRFQLEDMLPRFMYVALRTPPMPGRLLSMAENDG